MKLCVLFLDPPRHNLRPRPGGKPRPTGPKPKPKPKPKSKPKPIAVMTVAKEVENQVALSTR